MANDEQPTLQIMLLGADNDVPVEELGAEQSPHTGRDLRRVSISFDVSAERSAEVNSELSAAQKEEQALFGDGVRWRVLNSSYSYQEGDSTHRHHAELQEIEELPTASSLEMLGLSLQPRKYKETADEGDGTLLIQALVEVKGNDDTVLETAIREQRAKRGYFPITRVGVSDSPLEVRFGRCLWKGKAGDRLHLLRLVADADLEQESSPLHRIFQPELALTQRKTVAIEDQLNALVDALHESGDLSQAQVAAIRSKADDSWHRHRRDFDEAKNIESYLD
ncbi:MAG TPA: hypothetical protein VHI77_00915 [Solirubrobacterales bacterium]|jgi:hypothetical protein|nr:hypothetical protein [Solirubrobacterales bacterium]